MKMLDELTPKRRALLEEMGRLLKELSHESLKEVEAFLKGMFAAQKEADDEKAKAAQKFVKLLDELPDDEHLKELQEFIAFLEGKIAERQKAEGVEPETPEKQVGFSRTPAAPASKTED